MESETRDLASEAEATPGPTISWVFLVLDRVRPVAILAVVAAIVGRALAPALGGVAVGTGRIVDRLAFAGGALSQLLLLGLVWVLLSVAMAALQLRALPLAFRLVATCFAGIVLGVATPTSITKLPGDFALVLALAAIVTCLLGAAQAVVAPRTRAVGIMLGLAALASLTRQIGWILALWGGAHASLRAALTGRWFATGAFGLEAILVAFAILWLATRGRTAGAIATVVTTAVAATLGWIVEHADRADVGAWKLAVARAADHLLTPPPPLAPLGARIFLATSAIFLAIAALATVRRSPAIAGTFALVLLAGPDADVPLCGLGLAVAALAAALAAHDPRGDAEERATTP